MRFVTLVATIALVPACMPTGSATLQNKASVIAPNDTSNGDGENSSTYAAQQVSATSGGSLSVSDASPNEKLRGVTIDVPPGALAVDTTIYVKEVTDVANSVTLSALNIQGGSAAGPSVAIEASDMDALTGTLAISIPFEQGASLTQGGNIAVVGVFRSGNAAYTAETFVGSELKFDGRFITLNISKFGAYQAMNTPAPVEKKKVETSAGYVEKHVAKKAGSENYVAFLVQSPQDLPACDPTRLSHLYYVLKAAAFYTCDGSNWAEINIKGAKGDKGDTGAQGQQGTSGVGMDPSFILTRTDNGARFGYLRGFGSQLWAESDYGYYTSVMLSGTNYDVVRKTMYFSGRDCSGKKFLHTDGHAYDFRRSYYSFTNQHPLGRVSNSTMQFMSPASIIRQGETCHNLATLIPVKPNVKINGDTKRVGGVFYFSGSTDNSNFELWKSDGTDAGTVMLKDINPGTGASYPNTFAELNGKLIFRAYTPGSGEEIWISDGTAANTQMLKEIAAGSESSYPYGFTAVNGKLVFVARTPATGEELWVTDGTSANTIMIGDLYTGSSGSSINFLTTVGSLTYFEASDGSNRQLWRTDGTAAGTVNLTTGNADTFHQNYTRHDSLTVANSILYLVNGDRVWRTNGTPEGTWAARQTDNSQLSIASGHGYGAKPKILEAVGNDVVLLGSCSGGVGACDGNRHLWKWDGTQNGGITSLLAFSTTFEPNASFKKLGANLVVFEGPDAGSLHQIYRTDGTSGGTYSVYASASTYQPYSYFGIVLGSRALISLQSSQKLISVDGQSGGSLELLDGSGGYSDFIASDFQRSQLNGQIFFTRYKGNQCYMFTSDGTLAGTPQPVLLAENMGCHPYTPTAFGGRLYFYFANYLFAATPGTFSVKPVAPYQNGINLFPGGSVLLGQSSSSTDQLIRFHPGTNNTTDEMADQIPKELSEVTELTGAGALPVGVLLKKGQ